MRKEGQREKLIKAIFVPVMFSKNNSLNNKIQQQEMGAYRVRFPGAGALHGGRLASGKSAFGPAWAPAGASTRRKGHGRAEPGPFDPQVL